MRNPSVDGDAFPRDNSTTTNRKCPIHHRHHFQHSKESPEMRRATNRITALGVVSGAAVGSVLIGSGFGILLGGVTAGLVTRGAIKFNRKDRREPAKIY